MRLAVLSVLCLFIACFQEPPADRVWRCSAEQPGCPEGQTCKNDWCVKDGTAQPDMSLMTDGGAIPDHDDSQAVPGRLSTGHARCLGLSRCLLGCQSGLLSLQEWLQGL
jgi:hypothetical protein